MAEFTVANFKDVSGGSARGTVRSRREEEGERLRTWTPSTEDCSTSRLRSRWGPHRPPDGRVNMTPMWFDYEGDTILVNTAAHRAKCGWDTKQPQLTILLVNPENPYHGMSIKCTVENEIKEDGPGGEKATEQLDRIWTKYTGADPPYALRDPVIDENVCSSSAAWTRVATFGQP